MTDPTHFLDQIQAASDDARRRLEHTAVHMGPGAFVTLGHIGQAPWADREMHSRVMAAAMERRLRWCTHIRPSAPQPAALFAWEQPFFLRCSRCLDHDQIRLYGDADRTCDLCGFVEPAEIMPRQMTMGPIIVSYGACHTCVERA